MNKKILWLVAIVLVGVVAIAEAQQPTKISRIGYLGAGSISSIRRNSETFRKGLHDLGYVEGKNIEILARAADGKSERLAELAAELVRLQVAVIVTSGTAATKAAKQATTVIPIVVGSAGDLVGDGVVASLAHPGGNITGLTALSPDLSGKRLEILKGAVPKASRVAVIWHRNPADEKEVKETEITAEAMGVKLQSLPVQSSDEFHDAFAAMRREHAGALIIIQGPFVVIHRKQLFELAAKNRLPSICDAPDMTEDGCLMSYGPNRAEMYRRAAVYVDKILKGAKPADLPVEQPTKFELVVNLKTAKQISLTIPPNVLARADNVIK